MATSQTAPSMLSGTPLYPRRWMALTFIGLAQAMTALDATIVNIALPSAQADLGISDANRQWVITAYALAFGGLLLLGGRLSDQYGAKRTFLIGLGGFAAASAVAGLAPAAIALFLARAGQGLFAALVVPAALALITTLFTDARERAKAIGIYGAIAGGGAVLGVVLGGVLTEYATWRWTMLVNVPIAVIAALGASRAIPHLNVVARRSRLDLAGLLLSAAGFAALVFAFANAEQAGWTDRVTITSGIASIALLIAFVLVQRRVAAPLLPLRILTERNRAGAFLVAALAVVALFGVFLFLTYYLQAVLGYSALASGLSFVPMGLAMVIGSVQVAARASARFRPRTVMAGGLLTAALGTGLLTGISSEGAYVTEVLPGIILFGIGLGATLMPAVSLATYGVQPADIGAASAMINTAQQIGGAVGIALLNTIAASATSSRLESGTSAAAELDALVHGYTTAFSWSLAILLLGAVLATVLIDKAAPGANDGLEHQQATAIPHR